jgi:hypothetical protein
VHSERWPATRAQGTGLPNAKVVITNYFQIVSEKSDMVYVWELLRFWDVVGGGINVMSAPLRQKMSDQSLAFHDQRARSRRQRPQAGLHESGV